MQLDDVLRFFSQKIELHLGIVYSEHNNYQLQNRLEELARIMKLGSINELYAYAKDSKCTIFHQQLIDHVTNNETSFFRDVRLFNALEKFVLPEFAKKGWLKDEFVIWSAACSTGQEALSLAMTIKIWSEKNKQPVKFKIIGTDISDRALEKARSFTYTDFETMRGLAPELRSKFFASTADGRWQASRALTEGIEYRKLNLLDDFNFSQKFHLVLCRNVLIYQNVERKKKIITKLSRMPYEDGYLVLGAGESLIGLSDAFTQTNAEGIIIYKSQNKSKAAA